MIRRGFVLILAPAVLLAGDPSCPRYPSAQRTEVAENLDLDRAFETLSRQRAPYRNAAAVRHAAHANAMARRLETALRDVPGIQVAYPVQTNAVFAKIPERVVEALARRPAEITTIGVTVKLDLIEFTSYKKRVDDGNWTTTTDGYTSGFNPDEHLRQYAYTKGSRNYGGYSNKEYDALVDKADQEFDAKKRGEIMIQAQKLSISEADHIWLGCSEAVCATQPNVKGYIPTGEYPQTYRWDQLWLDA